MNALEVAKKIKETRKIKKMTGKKLADLLGYGAATISNWEDSKFRITFDNLIKISEALDVPFLYFLTDLDIKEIEKEARKEIKEEEKKDAQVVEKEARKEIKEEEKKDAQVVEVEVEEQKHENNGAKEIKINIKESLSAGITINIYINDSGAQN